MTTFTQSGLALAILAGFGFAALPASAQNLVKDGSFEAADPAAPAGAEDFNFTQANPFDTSWVISSGTAGINTSNPFIFDGSRSLFLTADDANSTTVTQNLATTAGQNYTLSFYADDSHNTPLTVTFGGTTLGPINIPQNGYPDPNSNAAAFTLYSFKVAAQSAFTGLTFTAPPGGVALDDISVTPAAVPEASTTISFGLLLALGGLVLVAHRKKTASA